MLIFLWQLLQNIPVCISFFKCLDSIILSVVRDYKIGKAHLCKPKTSGGLALPNFNSLPLGHQHPLHGLFAG